MKELEKLIQKCNLNILSLQKQSVRINKNHVEYIREAGDCNKNLQEKLGNITAERNSLEKSATLPRFEKGYPT